MFYALFLSFLSSILNLPGVVEEVKNDFDHDHPTVVEIRDDRCKVRDQEESFCWGG